MAIENAATRTRYETLMEIRYAARFNDLNARLYAHIRTGFAICTGLLGCTAVAGAIKENGLAAISGFIIAGLAVLDQALRLGDRVAAFRENYRKYTELEAGAAAMTDVELEAALLRLRASSGDYVSALRNHALNQVLRETGHNDQIVPLSKWEAFIAKLA